MADFEIKEPREFSTSVRKHERQDRANAQLFNAVYEILINNDAFLYEIIEELSVRLTEELSGMVPATRKVNSKALSEDILLSADDVSAIPAIMKGTAGGVAELDSAGKVLASQLPSFVDDVVEGYLNSGKMYMDAAHTTAIVGEPGKIYIDLHTSKTYRWSGSAYAVISDTIALGETSGTAYRGDRGKTAYEHSQASHAPSNAQKNVQADWNVTDTSADAFIKNKPKIPAAVAVKGNAETSYRTGNVNLTPGNIGALAAANVVNNLAATAAGFALDARQGKALNDKITALNSNLSNKQNSLTLGNNTITNLDSLFVGCTWFNADQNPTGTKPFNTYGFIIAFQSGGSNYFQIAIPYGNDTYDPKWRTYVNGAWQAWRPFYDTNLNAITRALQTGWGRRLKIPMGPRGELTNGIVIVNAEAIYLICQSGTWGSWKLSHSLVSGSTPITGYHIDVNSGEITITTSRDCTITYIGW